MIEFTFDTKLCNRFNRMLSDIDFGWLYAQVYNLPDNPQIVEIGSYLGTSSVALASGIKFWKNGKGRLFSIDPWICPEASFGDWEKNIIEFGLVDIITPIISKSHNIVDKFEDHSIDMVFIDGDKDQREYREYIDDWSKKVKPNGILCGHDYCSFESVKNAVNGFADDNDCFVFEVCGWIWWIVYKKEVREYCKANNIDKDKIKKIIINDERKVERIEQE